MAKFQTVKEYLSLYGPALSSDIAVALRNSGLSDVAARQRLSRLPSEVSVLKGIGFPKRARFLYLKNDFGTEKYWKALDIAIKQANPAYAAAIGAMRACNGYVRRSDFDVISGAPLKQKKQVSSDTVLNRLCIINILEKTHDPVHGECVFFKFQQGETTARANTLRARLATENVLLDAIRLWAGRMNISSPDATTVRSDAAPQYATFRFHLCGPSYLRPLRSSADGKIKPSFFVADVILGSILGEENVEAFIRKCRMLSGIRTVRPFLPMIIADAFTKEALRACRSEGIIATTPKTLFGEDVAIALIDLMNTLNNATLVAATKPEQLEKLFEKLSGIEGQAGNLRGALFELLVGHMVKKLESGSIDIGKTIYCPDLKTREMDVSLFKEKNVTIYECKGYQPDSLVRREEIDKWLQSIAQIYSAHKVQEAYVNSNISFEYWTCGSFNKDTIELLDETKSRLKKYSISWKNGDDIRKYASQLSAPGIKKILEEHYFNHPINLISKTLRHSDFEEKKAQLIS